MKNTSHQLETPVNPDIGNRFKQRFIFNFGLFTVFFIFYLGAAVIQTPAFKHIASVPFLGMPLGLFLSVAIFPVSWLLIIIFFAKGK